MHLLALDARRRLNFLAFDSCERLHFIITLDTGERLDLVVTLDASKGLDFLTLVAVRGH